MHTEKPSPVARDAGVAAIWAFAEATVFFIVPDVWLTRIAMRNRRNALIACVAATVGALFGGAILFALGNREPADAVALLDAIPGISPGLIDGVERQVREREDVALLRGPVTGTPYKVYAVEAGAAGGGLLAFLGWSIAARLPRFILLTLVASAAAKKLRGMLPERSLGYVHAGLWIAFYCGYFARFGW